MAQQAEHFMTRNSERDGGVKKLRTSLVRFLRPPLEGRDSLIECVSIAGSTHEQREQKREQRREHQRCAVLFQRSVHDRPALTLVDITDRST